MTDAAFEIAAPATAAINGLRDITHDAIAVRLGALLADTRRLLMKTRGVHLTVADVGPAFFGVCKLTEEHYEALHIAIDEIAERLRSLGRETPSTHAVHAAPAKAAELEASRTAAEMVRTLIADHEAIARSIRSLIQACEDLDDYETADLLIQRLAWHEKSDRMLSALAASWLGRGLSSGGRRSSGPSLPAC